MGDRAPAHRTFQNCSICVPGVCPKKSARLPILDGIQVLEANVAMLGGLITPVGAALVNEETAASGANITFSGAKDQFWGFRVIHGDDPVPQHTTFEVPTRSLTQIKVRFFFFSAVASLGPARVER